MRILNLYAGLGGNRTLWGDEHQVTAAEWSVATANVYRDRFPDDAMIVGDAHQYLLEHWQEFDLIWSSPPCQSHSSIRHHRAVKYLGSKPVYPDMRLYEEIVFLQNYAPKYPLWVVENVRPYYTPLVPATTTIDRHLYWSNFEIPPFTMGKHENLRAIQIPELQAMHDIDLTGYHLPDKRQALRNMVPAPVGLHILHAAEAQITQ